MKTKEAIEWLTNIIFDWDILTWEEKKRIHDEIDGIKALLKRGEECEKKLTK